GDAGDLLVEQLEDRFDSVVGRRLELVGVEGVAGAELVRHDGDLAAADVDGDEVPPHGWAPCSAGAGGRPRRPTAPPASAPSAAPAATSEIQCAPAQRRSTAMAAAAIAPSASVRRQRRSRGATQARQTSSATGPATCVLGKD